MRVLTGGEMGEVERRAVESTGVTLSELMERAGAAVARTASRMVRTGPVVIVSGKGNNGGDGIVAARLLAQKGFTCHLFLLCDEADLTPESTAALARLRELDGAPEAVPVTGKDRIAVLAQAVSEAALVVDCVFGFGLKGAARGLGADAIEAIGAASVPVLSVDIPSGVDADTGRVEGPAVAATRTVTFTAPKIGLVVPPGAGLAGAIEVADIGIPADLVEAAGATRIPDTRLVASTLPTRAFDAHKKSCGRVLVVAGSVGMTGAATLCAQSALRAGAGTVVLAVPESLNDIFEEKLTEVMTIPMPETPVRSLSESATGRILELCDSFDVLALGPGLSLDESTVLLVRALVERVALPLVLDADGLGAMVGNTGLLKARRGSAVLTPHSGELARLLDITADEVQADRLSSVRRASEQLGAIVVLKGAGTVIGGGGECTINTTGNPGLATAGTGDVLTGIIAALVAQGAEPYDAAVAGVYVHGLSGDMAASKLTERCLIASDVISFLPKAFRRVQAKRRSD